MIGRALNAALAAQVASWVVVVTPAFAQVADREPEAASQGDIVVTARRVEERLQDVPISITVFNQEQLANTNIVNSGDLATYTPSLQSNANFGSQNASFSIRGFVQDISTPPTVGFYFADVVTPRGPTGTTQAGEGAGPGYFFDLQNVQVLNGPQGTLFGRNTSGGAILVVPQRPTDQFGGYLEASYGNYDMVRLQGALNIPLTDTASFRIAADYMDRDGWLRNTSGIGPQDFEDVNYIAVRASLRVDLTPELENYTIVSYTRSDTNGSAQPIIGCAANLGFGGLACAQVARNVAAGNDFYTAQSILPNARAFQEQWQVINTTTWQVSDSLRVRNIASYGQLTNVNRTVIFGSDYRLGIAPLGIPEQRVYFATSYPTEGSPTADAETITEELQFQGSARRLTWQAGVYFEQTNPLSAVGSTSPGFVACSNIEAFQCLDVLGIGASAATGFRQQIRIGNMNYTSSRLTLTDVGVYAQGTYELTDALKVTGGIRYTWDRSSAVSVRRTTQFAVLPPFSGAPTTVCTDVASIPSCSESLEQESSAPTWLIGLDYNFTPDVLLYAKYARGYRAGGVTLAGPPGFRTFEQEQIDAYELGLKTSFRGPVSGTFNVIGFYNELGNQQLRAGFTPRPNAPVPNTSGVVNAGQSRIYGVEIAANISPFRGFSLNASYTYLRAEIISIQPIVINDPNYLASTVQIAPGSTLPLSPENRVTVTASYRLPLDEAIGSVTVGATYSYSDGYLTSYVYQDPTLRAAYGGRDLGTVDDIGLLNLNLNWNSVLGTPLDLAVFATNVTGEEYYAYSPGIGQSGAEYATVGQPRMYGVRLRYTFGN